MTPDKKSNYKAEIKDEISHEGENKIDNDDLIGQNDKEFKINHHQYDNMEIASESISNSLDVDTSTNSNSRSNSTWRPLRSRSFLTDAQVSILQTHFKRNPFPSKYELSAVAEQIGVNKRVVQVGIIHSCLGIMNL